MGPRSALLLALVGVTYGARVVELTPDNWHARVPGERWFIKFYQQGCPHCERMQPMWDAVAAQLSVARVGRVDCTAHNGIGRSFGLDKFPMVCSAAIFSLNQL